jgi:hypothetical protein
MVDYRAGQSQFHNKHDKRYYINIDLIDIDWGDITGGSKDTELSLFSQVKDHGNAARRCTNLGIHDLTTMLYLLVFISLTWQRNTVKIHYPRYIQIIISLKGFVK